MGKGKGNSQAPRQHQSRPLTTLKDPAEFGPPPRNFGYHEGTSGASAIPPARGASSTPSSYAQIEARDQQELDRGTAEESSGLAPPPGPYRVDTTGLSTDNLPKPPLRRVDLNQNTSIHVPEQVQRSKPSLPPRLPPRQNSSPAEHSLSPPPAYNDTEPAAPVQKSYLNQGSLQRLGSAGVSVPGLNVGDTSNPWHDERTSTAKTPANPQLSELQSRFSKMSTPSPTSESPSQGTSFAQKQAALKTASSFRNDPSSVTFSDAKSAASTANNFRQRHGDQVTSGWKTANGMNQKYGITNKVNNYSSGTASSQVDESVAGPASPVGSDSSAPFKKKPPPPPPKKRIAIDGRGPTLEPPPLPLSSKPRP